MYLRNVVCIGLDQVKQESINKKLINFNDNWRLTCLNKVEGLVIAYSYDFNEIYAGNNTYITPGKNQTELAKISLVNYFNNIGFRNESYATQVKKQKEIVKTSLMNYKYGILTQRRKYKFEDESHPSTEFDIYRIPRTFTIAYNETHLISASMRANLHYLFWLLTSINCVDIIVHIVAHLFAHCQYDYSLYICAN